MTESNGRIARRENATVWKKEETDKSAPLNEGMRRSIKICGFV